VTNVQFFAGTAEPLALVGQDSTPPFSVSFTLPKPAAVSTYKFRAVAQDNGGLSGQDNLIDNVVSSILHS
jgi:hypothetical protein